MAGASAVSRMSRQDMARLAEGAQEEDGEEDMAFIFNSRQIHYARLILKSRQMQKPTLPRLPDRVDTILEQWPRERPDLDPSPMRRIGRIKRLARLPEQPPEKGWLRSDMTTRERN